jgi:hypothetical protein
MGTDSGRGAAPSAGQPGRRTGALTDALLVQARTEDLKVIATVAGQEGSGLVLTGPKALDGVTTALRHHHLSRPVLVDRARYAGNDRVRGTEPFNPWWLAEQRKRHTTAVLTDSGYIGEDDLTALTAVLQQTARHIDEHGEPRGGVWAVLPLHASWLRTGLPLLIAQINTYRVPVALVLEHKKDPLGTAVAVQGLVEVLASPVPVALLCTDVSALGALAFGAQWTAVGVRSSLRHLYPVSDGFGQGGTVSALLDPVLTIAAVTKIAQVCADAPDEPMWNCHCATCKGRSPTWMVGVPQKAVVAHAARHTHSVLLERREGLTDLPDGDQRRVSWRAKCSNALWYYDALGLVDRYQWQVPGFIKSWQAV